MRVFYGFDALPHFVRPTVTVGSYDGGHSGHLALLRTVARRARAQGGESVVLTFEPHPRVTLGRADGLRLLTSLEEKIYLLGQQGIDNLIVIPFDKAFSALAPDTFIRDYLVGRIGAETLVVGFNHRFGRDKQGSYDYLGSHGFGLEVVEVGECDVDAEKVSSTVIRHLVAQGDMARAARLLSHPYLVIGTAAAGRIRTDDPLKLLPPAGSYQVRIGGRPARLTVDASQNLIIRDGCPDGRAVLTF
ncbi:FAD synthetase family protein [Alistipes onderdonkii]|nr:FAD synthetase family protein [Alistipes onderdonkii]